MHTLTVVLFYATVQVFCPKMCKIQLSVNEVLHTNDVGYRMSAWLHFINLNFTTDGCT